MTDLIFREFFVEQMAEDPLTDRQRDVMQRMLADYDHLLLRLITAERDGSPKRVTALESVLGDVVAERGLEMALVKRSLGPPFQAVVRNVIRPATPDGPVWSATITSASSAPHPKALLAAFGYADVVDVYLAAHSDAPRLQSSP